MRILVFGKDGQVGRELVRLGRAGEELVALGRQECDLSNRGSIQEQVRRVAPQVIINAAAYTAVDQAEKERDLCFAVNAVAPGVLAEEAAKLKAILIHISTDYVFNGEKQGPYVETDLIDPLSVYGASKAAGEAAVAQVGGRYLVLRTSWVYGPQGKNFLTTMLRLGSERQELRVVDDQSGAPTSARSIAAATSRLVHQYAQPTQAMPAGIYHMTAEGSTSWCGFARAIFDVSGNSARPRVLAITTADYPTPAKRPKNSVLSNRKFEDTFGFRLSSWKTQLHEVMGEIFAARSPKNTESAAHRPQVI
ncbi:MAG TPA: dTDP-4-dehydrorhamnose reductase [Acidobacteriaceae bacterium]|jgi:dTDP-4-dehydrorhamnose reductase